ncbi:hypothetical protein Sjap_023228 [Stephania japonica]|uniref:Uncharacterized protein n=1 Tax=Stephania japonica TaxID=461633 RepID=A0AAP0EB80_9MAGN
MKGTQGGGRKKIDGALPQQLQGDEEEDNIIICDNRMEVVRAERAAGEFNDDGNVDDEDDGEEEKVGEEDEGERPKLAEGFYEIEGVRRKRRKRKQGFSHTQAKKKQCSTSTSSLPCIKVGSGYRHLLSASLVSSSISKSPHLKPNDSKSDDHLDEVTNYPGNGVLAGRQPENMSANVLLVDDQDKEADLTRCNGEGVLADKLNAGRMSTHIPDALVLECDGLKEELQKSELQTSRCTGARKRKSGFVRRFKQESTSHESGDAQNSIARCVIGSGDKLGALGMEDAESLGDDLGDKNNLDHAVTPSSITKIIKAIGYSASISNNIQDVLITFVAMRSDGREVVVDSKFLKVNNPLLDIEVDMSEVLLRKVSKDPKESSNVSSFPGPKEFIRIGRSSIK